MYYDYHSRIKRYIHLKTKTMRTTKELLEIVLDEFENERLVCRYRGICACIYSLRLDNLITSEEKYFLIRSIEENRPKEGMHFCKPYAYEEYFWKPGSKPPRIAWLKHLIKTIKNN